MSFYKRYFKRFLDLIFSIFGFIIISSLFLIITLLLIIANRGKPFFFQTRPGRNGVLFRIIKFRTMNNKRDKAGNLLPDDKRLTLIGSMVRKTSMDEIPQLINVIIGDMSLIGPRPLLPEYLPFYTEKQCRRHECKPGITGWAQVNGRNAISWDEKFKLDVWYIDNINFLLDIKIIFLTIKKVVQYEGISAEGHVTMPTFIDYIKNENDHK